MFLVLLLGRMLPSAFLLPSKVLSKDSGDWAISCLDVLLTSVDLILPMFSHADLGLKVFRGDFHPIFEY